MKKGKIAALALAGTLTATALLAGTYAWTSISQRAVNEAEGEVNPGGRLHDDYNGTNKDIYVENFTSDEEGSEGAIIYARIKLNEYLEIGETPVKQNDTDNPSKTDSSTWTLFKLEDEEDSIFRHYYDWEWGGGTTYMPTFNKNKDSLEADINGTYVGADRDRETGDAYDDYQDYTQITSEYGLEIYDIDGDTRDEDEYLSREIIKALHDGNGKIAANFYNDTTNPTITASNTMSLPATDVNGAPLLDSSGAEVSYTVKVMDVIYETDVNGDPTATVEAVELDIVNATKDAEREDGNTAETLDEPDIRVEVVKNAEGNAAAHEAEPTLETVGVISMADWKTMGSPSGRYWVYDTDGWAYWAEGIQPGTATGCLLTAIDRTGSIVDKYYYAINVTAEFATAGDWGEGDFDTPDGTGFYKNCISEDGLYLLNTIAGAEKDLFINLPDDYDAGAGVAPDNSIELTASVKLGAQTVSGDEVVWTVTGATDATGTGIVSTAKDTAKLTVGASEEAYYVTVTAALKDMPQVTASKNIAVGPVYTVTVDETAYLAAENVKTATLTATVTDQRGDTNYVGVTWALAEEQTGVSIDAETGVLTISNEVDATTIKVKATAKADGTTVGEGTITVKSQMEYIASLTVTADSKPKAVVDGVEWYVLRKQDANTAVEGNEALLWATAPVEGWLRGDQAADQSWIGWSYYNTKEQVPFKTTESKEGVSGYENWWRYSNLRTWLNSAETETGNEMTTDENGKPVWSDTTTSYDGFLKGKDIINANAVPMDIYTRKEYNLTGLDEENHFDKATGDKVFIFTQADIYGHAPGLETDADGNVVKDEEGKDKYVANGVAVAKDYTVDANLHNEITASMRTTSGKWHWLRSPRNHADYVSIVYTDGDVDDARYYNTWGYVRPALWLNLSSTAQ